MKGGKRGFLRDFLVVLILLLIVLVIPLVFPPSSTSITGAVVSPVSLLKTEYVPSEKLSGDLDIHFKKGDLIPENSKMYLFFQSPKCPTYFVCNANEYIPWCNYSYEGKCDCVDLDTIKAKCGALINLACEDSTLSIESYCCEERGMIGRGIYYENLVCTKGNCWSECQEIKEQTLPSMISYSSTPNKGNYTYGRYNNVDGDDPAGEGYGFSYCGSGSPFISPQGGYSNFPINEIVGYAVSQPACSDTDGGDKPYIGGTCVDYTGNSYSDSCLIGATEDLVVEYYCSSISNSCVSKKYICAEGCVESSPTSKEQGDYCKSSIQPIPCTDSDLGKVFGIKGTCSDYLGTYTDTCILGVAEDILNEYWCDPYSKSGLCLIEQTTCLYGCYDGACKSQPTTKCSDPDKDNIFVKSTCSDRTGSHTDYCIPESKEQNEVMEYICGVDSLCTAKKITCNYGCYDGACKSQPTTRCYDTDDGFNFYALGTCTDYLGSYTDSCLISNTVPLATTMAVAPTSTKTLVEYGCVNNVCDVKQYSCPYGCLSGVCKDPNCEDTDGDNPFKLGTCNDLNGVHTDYCVDITGVNPATTLAGLAIATQNSVVEYYCSSTSDDCTTKTYTCDYGCYLGACLEQPTQPPPQDLPDLTVSGIHQGLSPTRGSKKLLAVITNQGEGSASSFRAVVYFTTANPGTRPTIIAYVDLKSLPARTSYEVDFGDISVDGKTVAVYADYYNIIKETNENNNLLTQYFATTVPCTCNYDSGWDVTVYGTCIDSTGILRREVCLSDSNTLQEWYCETTNVEPSLCKVESYDCRANGFAGCANGACVKQTYVDCTETDNGNDPGRFGTCSDYNTASISDSCTSSKTLNEYYCSNFGNTNEPAECTLAIHECQYGCGAGACESQLSSQYSCDNWDSVYNIDFLNMPSLSVPSKEGVYNLTALLIYTDSTSLTLLSQSTSALFVVKEAVGGGDPPPGGGGGPTISTYKACINETCMVIQGTEQDECDTSSDCEYAPPQSIACVNYVIETECLYAGCYWYDYACHSIPESQLGGTPYYSSPTPPSTVEEVFTDLPWWVYFIIGLVVLLIVVLVILKKGLPIPKKSGKEEKKELIKKYPALIAYINKAKEGGMLKEQLREKLMSKGWPVGIIDKAMSQFWDTKEDKKKKGKEKKKEKGLEKRKELPPAPKMAKVKRL